MDDRAMGLGVSPGEGAFQYLLPSPPPFETFHLQWETAGTAKCGRPGQGPPLCPPPQTWPTAGQTTWSQRAWHGPGDSMGIITTGNPLTTSITKTMFTGMKQKGRHTIRCHLPKTKWGGEKSSSCQSQGAPTAPALLALGLNTYFPEAFPDSPTSQELSALPWTPTILPALCTIRSSTSVYSAGRF